MSYKCKPIIINCCDHCYDTPADVEDGSVKSPYIGENGNWFTWNGEEWEDTGVKAGGESAAVAADLPWIQGVFANKSITANSSVVLTPTYQLGEASLISGNRFIAPESGLYNLNIGGGRSSTTASMYSIITLNDEPTINDNADRTKELGISMAMNTNTIPAINVLVHLNANDYLVYALNTTTAMSSINGVSGSFASTHKFTFTRLR